MIRHATPDDIPALLELARAFHAASQYADLPFDERSTESTARTLIETALGTILISEDRRGSFWGVLTPAHFNHNVMLALELAWGGAHGAELIEAAKAWAASHGAWLMAGAETCNRERAMARFYRRCGLKPAGSSYVWRPEWVSG